MHVPKALFILNNKLMNTSLRQDKLWYTYIILFTMFCYFYFIHLFYFVQYMSNSMQTVMSISKSYGNYVKSFIKLFYNQQEWVLKLYVIIIHIIPYHGITVCWWLTWQFGVELPIFTCCRQMFSFYCNYYL